MAVRGTSQPVAQWNVDIEPSLAATGDHMSLTTRMTKKTLTEQALLSYFLMAEGRARDPDGLTVDLGVFLLDLHDPLVRQRLQGCDLRLSYFASLEAILRSGLDTAVDGKIEIDTETVERVLDARPSRNMLGGAGGAVLMLVFILGAYLCSDGVPTSFHDLWCTADCMVDAIGGEHVGL